MARESTKKEPKKKLSKKKRKLQLSPKEIIVIKATPNNTHVTCRDNKGNVFFSSTSGMKGFKGAKKATPYAAMLTAKDVATMAYNEGVRTVNVFIKGIGAGRELSIKGLVDGGLSIGLIIDNTPVVHNGCRPPKERRN